MEALAKDVLEEPIAGGVASWSKLVEKLEHSHKDSSSNEWIKGPLYYSKSMINNQELEVFHSENMMNQDDQNNVHPLIFYRMTKLMKKDKGLPTIDLTKFYKTDTTHHIDFELVPDLSYQKNNRLIKSTQEEWDEVLDNYKKYDSKHKKEML